MRSSVVAFLFCFLSPIANADYYQIRKPVLCGELESFVKEISQKYKETIFWVGTHQEAASNYVLLVNSKTQTWTMLQAQGQIACILGTGTANQFLLGQPLID